MLGDSAPLPYADRHKEVDISHRSLHYRPTPMLERILETIASFPTILWTVPLGVVVLFWLVSLLGLVGVDSLDFDADVDADVDADLDAHAHGGFLKGVADLLQIGSVPITIVGSTLVVAGWASSFLLDFLAGEMLRAVVTPIGFGAAAMVLTLIVAVLVTGFAVRPLAPLFEVSTIRGASHLVGHVAEVTSGKVTASFGTARMRAPDGSSDLTLNIVGKDGYSYSRGTSVTIVGYDAATNTYTVVPLDVGLGEHDLLLASAHASEGSAAAPVMGESVNDAESSQKEE